MKRRQMLIGTGTMLATGLVGYSSASLAHESEDDHTKSETNGHKKRGSKKHKDEEEEDYDSIPGFDREEFELDSDVLHVKDLGFHKGTLELSVIVETTDGDVLAEELQALIPAFNQAIREADAEEFFEAVEEFKFALYDECDVLRAALYLDIQWLRECLFGDLTTEEFVNRILMILGAVGDDGPGNPNS
ncbi:hypothetical protein HAPAU_32980 [Halalkalicoccus paucihalophilus]|uniref:Uncharacterized protein n=1 Tax=Halalkalicoccus paucihalophilus TaxID=1008153 RepID=A0A151A9K0_9EURY|nr:hypothetical protein [Halalkalicoccus paucihalophilus]KYH24315.1 hypothetical protein HAPAU_32980 [Halalkalicoccus paucihalophilus]